MPRAVFEPTISAFERAKTVHALDRAATVICLLLHILIFHVIPGIVFLSETTNVHVTPSASFFISWCGVRLSPLGTSATDWPVSASY
jgi:hypothetical protein